MFVRAGRDVWLGCERNQVRWFVCDISSELKGRGAEPGSILDYTEVSPIYFAETHPTRFLEAR